MYYSLKKDRIIKSKSLRKLPILIYFILSIIFLYIIGLLKEKVSYFSNISGLSPTPGTITSQSRIADFTFILPWIIIIGLLAISLTPLGLFTQSNPKSLSEIITSNNFDIQIIKSEDNSEIGIIKLSKGKIKITWERTSGQFYTWTLLIKVLIEDSTAQQSFDKFTKLLFMEKDPSENLLYTKVIPVRDWPRQEYLIHYWLEGFDI